MEINHLFALEDNGALLVHDSDEALAKVNFWFDTPEGEYWGNASWGHQLDQFRHEPMNDATEVAMENSVLMDLPSDIPTLQIHSVRFTFLSLDEIDIEISTNFGLVKTTYNRAT